MENHHIRLKDILPQKRLLVTKESFDPFLQRDKPYIHVHLKENDETNTLSVVLKTEAGRTRRLVSRNFKKKEEKE